MCHRPTPNIVLLTAANNEPEASATKVAAALRAHPARPTHLEGVIDIVRRGGGGATAGDGKRKQKKVSITHSVGTGAGVTLI
jgi:hypothetical protein